MTDIKLQKALAHAGCGSRRQIEGWIQEGRVLVNGQCATIGMRVDDTAQICLDGHVVNCFDEQKGLVLLYNKPLGQICTRSDTQGRETVFEYLPAPPKGQRWIMVGRLDINSQGLLLFTTNGDVAHRLMHPSTKLKRVYNIRIGDELSAKQIRLLMTGIDLEDGTSHFDSIRHLKTLKSNSWYQVVISSGKNRIIRRLIASQGSSVSKLVRIKYGQYSLPRSLQVGAHKLVPNLLER